MSASTSSHTSKNEREEAGTSESNSEAANNGSSSTECQKKRQRYSKIARGFSMVDPEMVSKLHTDITMKGKDGCEESYGYFQDVTRFSFTLPDFLQYDKQFQEFLMKDLVENSTLKSLENSGHLNWLAKNGRFQRLLPLATSGDGNCLLHAASLGILGVHDRLLNLRRAVHHTLSTSLAERTIKRRWRWYQWVKNMGEGELVFSEKEWDKEWQLVLSLADPKPRSLLTTQSLATVSEVTDSDKNDVEVSVNTLPKPRRFSTCSEPRYESLEEIHVFSLAHVLRRPIVVVADTILYDFEGNAVCPIPFGGVYLPVECDPSGCCRIPLVLAYSSGHFSPVVAMEVDTESESSSGSDDVTSTVQVAIPLVARSLTTLPLPFAVDPGDGWDWLKHDKTDEIKNKTLSCDQRMVLLKKYLDIVYINLCLPPVQQSAEGRKEGTTEIGGSDIYDRKTEDVDTPVQHSIAVAILPCGNQPSYYKELITGYIEIAKGRFKFEQEMNDSQPAEAEMSSVKCANDGCDLYGTVANNYLCTKCFQLQSKSIKEFEPKGAAEQNSSLVEVPPYDPPSYSEVVQDNRVFYPPSFSSTGFHSNVGAKTLSQLQPVQCQAKGCTFYGTADKNGFCSKCYHENKK